MSTRLPLACVTVTAVAFLACGVGVRIGTAPPKSTPATSGTQPGRAETVISSLGKIEPFGTLESAEIRLGWRIMHPRDPRFHLVQQGGLLRTLADVGLARLEQAYAMDFRRGLVEIYQEPEAYPLSDSGGSRPITLGLFEGRLYGKFPHGIYYFFSGERIGHQRIRVGVTTDESSDLTADEFVAFVESLAAGP